MVIGATGWEGMNPFRAVIIRSLFGMATVVLPTGAGVIRHDVSDSFYLNEAGNYPRVGFFDPEFGFGLCSSVLIDLQWALIAGHCIDPVPPTANFIPGPDPIQGYLNGLAVSVDQFIPHPNFVTTEQGFDIGILHLAAPVDPAFPPAVRYNGTLAIPPAVRHNGTLAIPEMPALVATFVGYGTTGTGLTGAVTLDLTKRAGTNEADALAGNVLPIGPAPGDGKFDSEAIANQFFVVDFDDPGDLDGYNAVGGTTPLPLEYLVAGGDSGGGVFADLGSGPRLIGLNIFIDSLDPPLGDGSVPTDATYSDLGGAIILTPALNGWINQVTGLPEPASLPVFLALIVPVLIARRRRWGNRGDGLPPPATPETGRSMEGPR